MANKILKMRRSVPRFPRVDSHKKNRLQGKGWRKSKGRHTRVKRLSLYHGASPKIGYGTAAKTRHCHSSGLKVVTVANVNDLEKINPQVEGIKILKVGMKKKIDILKNAMHKKIRIFNVRKPEEFIKQNEKITKKEVKEA